MRENNQNNTQSGSVFIWIFIAVLLFAALGYAFSSGNRTSAGFISDVQAEAYASQILSFSSDVKNAVKRLTLRGCSDIEISFENNLEGGFINPNSPTDESCHVFSSNGGGLQYLIMPDNIYLPVTGSSWQDFKFSGSDVILGHGDDSGSSSGADLFINLGVNYEICAALNEKLGIPFTAQVTPIEQMSNGNFNGTYSFNSYYYGDHGTATGLVGKQASCVTHPTNTETRFYYVLLAR